MHYLDIELKGLDENGNQKKYKLSDFNGKNVIIYFYPQDGTPVCTEEAQLFRDAKEEIRKYATVIGVSKNDLEDHSEFKTLHNLNFIMLCDTENKLKKAFEAHDKYINNLHRATFILDKTGNIVKYWDKVDIDGHIEEIIVFFNENLKD